MNQNVVERSVVDIKVAVLSFIRGCLEGGNDNHINRTIRKRVLGHMLMIQNKIRQRI